MASGLRVAQFLESHSAVKQVLYPGKILILAYGTRFLVARLSIGIIKEIIGVWIVSEGG